MQELALTFPWVVLVLQHLQEQPTPHTGEKCGLAWSYSTSMAHSPHWGEMHLGKHAGACYDFSTGWPVLALSPGTFWEQPTNGRNNQSKTEKNNTQVIFQIMSSMLMKFIPHEV